MVAVDQVQIPLRDGVKLTADVTTRPDAPAPALLTCTPYGRPTHRQRSDVIGLARSGWAVVGADVRGRGESDGVFTPFHQEIADGYDTIEWIAAQPW